MSNIDDKVFYFDEGSLEKQLETLVSKGITQFRVCDSTICTDKKHLLHFIQLALEKAPSVFYDFYLEAAAGPSSVIDDKTIEAFSQLFCSLHIPVPKKDYFKPFSKKIARLNNQGLVFGFELNSTCYTGMKSFCEVLNFAIELYPNDVMIVTSDLKPNACLTTQDIKKIKWLSFAVYTFYSAGRAVPWFNAALLALRITPFKFFTDFSEWQYCNHASINEFNPDNVSHTELEKMQLVFLQIKFEEKGLLHVFPVLKDLVCLQGAFSRVSAGESNQEILDISYYPDDILSPFAMDLISFADQVCMENTTIKVFARENEPDFQIITN
ncbi:MAG: hypothetical protein BKP49_04945 [Treponema sp. CETP13]|nr:MAG: hypothetical protein BKP49_04945 [Treponema sp. CETP13]